MSAVRPYKDTLELSGQALMKAGRITDAMNNSFLPNSSAVDPDDECGPNTGSGRTFEKLNLNSPK